VTRRLISCRSCGRTRPCHAYDLCSPCYDRGSYHGTPGDPPPPRHGRYAACDEAAIHRAVAGWRGDLTAPERAAAIRELSGRGLTRRQIADLIGCCHRTVERHLADKEHTP
jgi:hypothetical protein